MLLKAIKILTLLIFIKLNIINRQLSIKKPKLRFKNKFKNK